MHGERTELAQRARMREQVARVPERIELGAVLAGLGVEQTLRTEQLQRRKACMNDGANRRESVGVGSLRVAARVIRLAKQRLVLNAQPIDLHAAERVELDAVDQPFGEALPPARADGATVLGSV